MKPKTLEYLNALFIRIWSLLFGVFAFYVFWITGMSFSYALAFGLFLMLIVEVGSFNMSYLSSIDKNIEKATKEES